MKIIRRISLYFERIVLETNQIKSKQSLMYALLFAVAEILCWIICGKINSIVLLYDVPKLSMNLPLLYFFWLLSFVFCGIMFSLVVARRSKYNRKKSRKLALYIIIMQFSSFIAYPLFFSALSLFFTCVALLFSVVCCICIILEARKMYPLLTFLMIFHLIWLMYNLYVCFGIMILN